MSIKERRVIYSTLATKIIETLEKITDDKNFKTALEDYYSDSLNESIITYKYYIRDIKNTAVAEMFNIRTLLVDVFREIEDSNRDEAIEILSERIKKEYNSVKRKERYIREKAKNEGKEYISELVNFNNIDEDAEIIEDESELTEPDKRYKDNNQNKITPSINITFKKDNDEVTKTSEEFDIYEQLNNQKAEEFGKLVKQQELENLDEPTNSITTVKINQSKIIQQSSQTKPHVPNIVSEPEYIEEDLYEYPDEVIQINGYNFNVEYKNNKSIVIYHVIVNGSEKLSNIKPFIPTIISNTSFKSYLKEKGPGNISQEVTRYNWQLRLTIVTNENIENIIEKLKGYRIFKTASFKYKSIFRVRNNEDIFLIMI